jgi:hypothetical protein
MPRATRAEQAKALDVHPKTLQTYLRRRRR